VQSIGMAESGWRALTRLTRMWSRDKGADQ